MNFHIFSSLPKLSRITKSALIGILFLPSLLVACSEDPAVEKASRKEAKESKEIKPSPLELEIRNMLLTEKFDSKKLKKIVLGKAGLTTQRYLKFHRIWLECCDGGRCA